MFNLFFRFRIILFLTLHTLLVFNCHLHAQEAVNAIVEEEQPSEKKLIRVRRVSPVRRGSSPRVKSPTRTTSNTGNTNPIGQGGGRRSPSSQQLGSSTRDSRSPTRSSTKSGRKRPSPTKPKGSPPKQAKITQKPVDPGTLPVIYAPNAKESNDRYKSLRVVEANYKTPFTFSSPSNSVVGSRNFRLQWRTNGSCDAGMEHILKRHTREFHDGSFKKKQSMFPQGTTHVEIRDMIQKAVENPQSNLSRNTELGVEFQQIEGRVAHQGRTIPLVVGYRKNIGLNKPLDIVQAYPKGMEYEVSILPKSTRRRRAARRLPRLESDHRVLGLFVEREALTADLLEAELQRRADKAEEKEREMEERQRAAIWGEEIDTSEEQRSTLRPLALDFSHEENQSQAVSILWEDNENYLPSSSLIDYMS